jgi:glycosyltransferase involved in cell wall biosynthesis
MGAELLHAPAFVGSLLSSCRQVITVHDLSFLRHPEFFRKGNRVYLSLMTGIACRRAEAVIAVSDFTAREVVALLRVAPERVVRIYHGVAERFHPLPAAAVAQFRRDKGLPERFVLFMGTLEPRKNLIRLVRAFARLTDPALHLVLAGAQGWFYSAVYTEVARLGLEDRVRFAGYVPASEQAFWYNAADVFAYLSTYEGFGMPVLEALACGLPVVASATTSLPEAGGKGARLVRPDDEGAIADALHDVLANAALRGQMREQGLHHAAQFSWNAAAAETLAVYERVIGGAP